MAKLTYTVLSSLDGYMADETGNFDWAAPDEEVHAFLNDRERPVGTYLLGRRMYDVMVAWETMPTEGEPEPIKDFAALWHAADKIVYSRTLTEASSARTRIEHDFDSEAVQRLKTSSLRDLSIGGAELATEAFAAGLVDEMHVYLAPVIVGGGNRSLPDGLRIDLELLEERRFSSGFVYLHYRVV